MHEYENIRRVSYHSSNPEQDGTAIFIPVCPNCGRFVKADNKIKAVSSGISEEPNADCKKCGRVAMPGEGIL